MENCEQVAGINVLQHGQSVWSFTKKLIVGDFQGFKLPEWFTKNHHFIINNLVRWEVIRTYNIYHDCGKSYCFRVDEQGKRHFPNHAEVSKRIYLETFAPNGFNEKVANLIGWDMLCHSGDYEELSKLSIETQLTLLITAFAEIHSNAEMFGGIESTSFKIKWKRLDKIGKKIIAKLAGHQDKHSYLIIRNDLPDAQKVVQASHATWEGAKYGHPSLVCLVVKSEFKLKQLMSTLIDNHIQFTIFREPLFDNSITAICTEPLVGEQRDVLKKYQLL